MRSQRADRRGHWPRGRRRNTPRPNTLPLARWLLARHRGDHGLLSVNGLARMIGAHRRTVHHWLSGEDAPSDHHLAAIRTWLRRVMRCSRCRLPVSRPMVLRSDQVLGYADAMVCATCLLDSDPLRSVPGLRRCVRCGLAVSDARAARAESILGPSRGPHCPRCALALTAPAVRVEPGVLLRGYIPADHTDLYAAILTSIRAHQRSHSRRHRHYDTALAHVPPRLARTSILAEVYDWDADTRWARSLVGRTLCLDCLEDLA